MREVLADCTAERLFCTCPYADIFHALFLHITTLHGTETPKQHTILMQSAINAGCIFCYSVFRVVKSWFTVRNTIFFVRVRFRLALRQKMMYFLSCYSAPYRVLWRVDSARILCPNWHFENQCWYYSLSGDTSLWVETRCIASLRHRIYVMDDESIDQKGITYRVIVLYFYPNYLRGD
jgi:hypothetical protein